MRAHNSGLATEGKRKKSAPSRCLSKALQHYSFFLNLLFRWIGNISKMGRLGLMQPPRSSLLIALAPELFPPSVPTTSLITIVSGIFERARAHNAHPLSSIKNHMKNPSPTIHLPALSTILLPTQLGWLHFFVAVVVANFVVRFSCFSARLLCRSSLRS